jgi:hypothetical protein
MGEVTGMWGGVISMIEVDGMCRCRVIRDMVVGAYYLLKVAAASFGRSHIKISINEKRSGEQLPNRNKGSPVRVAGPGRVTRPDASARV